MPLPDMNSNQVKRLLQFESWEDDEREKNRWLSLWNERIINPNQECFEHYQEHVKEVLSGFADNVEILGIYD